MHFFICVIHGDLKAFKKLLRHVDLSNDILIILGDILDKGRYPVQSFDYIRTLMQDYSGHVVLTKGNHELFASMYLDGSLSEKVWLSHAYGGKETLMSLKAMSSREISNLKNFIDDLPLYYCIDSPWYGKCVATHSGLHADYIVKNADGSVNVINSIEKGYSSNAFEYLCSGDIHRMPTNNLDHYMIVGHVPCVYLEGASYKILKRKRYMCIDSGAEPECKKHGGRLSMYCVEQDLAYY